LFFVFCLSAFYFIFVLSLLVADVLRVADRVLLARLVVADPVLAAEGLRPLRPQAVRLLAVPVVDVIEREDGQLRDLLLRSLLGLLCLLGSLDGLRSLLDLLLGRRRRGRRRSGSSLRRLQRSDLLRRRHGRHELRRRRRNDDLLGTLCLGLRRLVVRLPLSDEGVVAGAVLSTDTLDDLELVALLRDALEGIGLRRLNVLDVGRPGERASGSLALGLGITLDLRLLRASLAALLADGSGDALVERELLGEGHRLHQRGDLVDGGHL